MSTSKYLALIATAAENLAGISTTTNQSFAGYWERIALAAEALAGAATSASDFVTGWMKRAAIAINDYTAFGGSGFNPDESGYMAWMVAALENTLGITTTGSWEYRLYTLLTSFSIGLSFDSTSITFDDTTPTWDMT